MLKQLLVIVVIIALSLAVAGCCCCCCTSSGHRAYYTELQDVAGSTSGACGPNQTCNAGGCQSNRAT